jgi:hypothetical protein
MEYVRDPLTQEIDAMAVIGQVLGKLPDAAARQRVLKWALERYAMEVIAPQQQAAPRAEAPAAADATLAVDSLNDIFNESRGFDEDLSACMLEPAVEGESAKAPLQKVLQSFAKDFQRFAEEWKGAAA